MATVQLYEEDDVCDCHLGRESLEAKLSCRQRVSLPLARFQHRFL